MERVVLFVFALFASTFVAFSLSIVKSADDGPGDGLLAVPALGKCTLTQWMYVAKYQI